MLNNTVISTKKYNHVRHNQEYLLNLKNVIISTLGRTKITLSCYNRTCKSIVLIKLVLNIASDFMKQCNFMSNISWAGTTDTGKIDISV